MTVNGIVSEPEALEGWREGGSLEAIISSLSLLNCWGFLPVIKAPCLHSKQTERSSSRMRDDGPLLSPLKEYSSEARHYE